MDRLTSFDASFLAQEREGSHMHIGGILIFEGPPPVREELNGHISSRLHLVPRYRQKLAFPRFEMGRPLWIEDPRFNIDYHVRHTALPAPGTAEQLRLLAARVFSQRLDRSKPLWEIWLVEGLEAGRFALVNKTHHCLVDGVSGVDITAVLLDLDREPAEKPAAGEEWTPGPEPSDAQIVGEGVRGLVRAPLGLAGAAAGALQRPGAALDRARQATERPRGSGLGDRQPLARDAAQREDRAPSAAALGPHPSRGPQGDQERAGRHGQRRVPGARHRRAATLAARQGPAHGGPRAAGRRPRLRAHRRRAGHSSATRSR